jgi:site-specific DNA-cytosine methylase
MGYNAEWGVLGADDVGAPHIRKRIWILAYAQKHGWNTRWQSNAAQDQEWWKSDRSDVDANVADSTRVLEGRSEQRSEWERAGKSGESINVSNTNSQRCQLKRIGGVLNGERQTFGNNTDRRNSAVPDANGEPKRWFAESRCQCRFGESEPYVC